MTPDSDPHAPATHLLDLFRRHAPEAAATVAPLLPRLLHALADGHAFVWLSAAEREAAASAAPLVGHNGASPLVLQGRKLFLARQWQLERDLANEINRLSTPIRADERPADALAAAKLQQWFDGEHARDQQAAAALTLCQRFVLIGGGPGTGKTTTIAKLLALLCAEATRRPSVALAAPTGKAAARMSQALHRAIDGITGLDADTAAFLRGLESQTIHRLLRLRPPHMTPFHHARNRLAVDILVADEASMIDNHLFWQLLCALPDHCRVILLGDSQQLPPVGAGAVLNVLAADTDPPDPDTARTLHALLPAAWRENVLFARHARLHISHRFGSDSAIGCLARASASGDADTAWQQFARFPNHLQQRHGTPAQQAEAFYRAQHAYWQAVDAGDIGAAFARHTDTVVLAARRRDAAAFNQACLDLLRRHGRRPSEWFAGQILLITRNDPATALANGDIGLVLPHENGLAAWFAGAHGLRRLPLNRLPAHETAFAITVHKSQGSEYRDVWLLPADGDDFTRALLYTAITRATTAFSYWGSEESFRRALARAHPRRSNLGSYLHPDPA
ncbi:exodeoxyribonuclease V subunit alpha [Conchiformibius kuhniae]|uniref:RecBCD enzyme subunit RecD n=2 Tax=Conchiformibius kuhniae TaxID=211502 RepID=A0ABD8B8M2_9NEIS